MSEGTQYIGMTATQIADHDFKSEHGHGRELGHGDFMIGGIVWPGLSKLIEESGEVLQVCGKLMGSAGSIDHWSGDLDIMLHEELGDLLAAINFLVSRNNLDKDVIHDRATAKFNTFIQWHNEAIIKRESEK